MTKVSLRFKHQQQKVRMVSVRYIYLDAGEFLYDEVTGRLFSTDPPHTYCGTLQGYLTCQYALQCPLQTLCVGDLQSQMVCNVDDVTNKRR